MHTHKIHKLKQLILKENNEHCESISTPSSNLRHKSYEPNINEMKQMPFTNQD